MKKKKKKVLRIKINMNVKKKIIQLKGIIQKAK